MAGRGGAPCGACKFLRRKCVKGCVFAPYFSSEELGAAQFSAIHKIFGASNFSKLLQHIPSEEERYDAVVSISYEAQARLHDPIYGCVSHIFALQNQVANLQAELAFAHARLVSSSDGVPLNPHYLDRNDSEIPTSPISSPYGRYSSSNEPQSSHQSPPENTTFCSDNNCSHNPLSAAQQMNFCQDDENSFEESPEYAGDLQALAFSLLRRSRKK